LSQIAVDHHDLLRVPSQRHRSLPQPILPFRAFGVFKDLPHGRLSNIQIRIAGAMFRPHLLLPLIVHGDSFLLVPPAHWPTPLPSAESRDSAAVFPRWEPVTRGPSPPAN